MKKAILIMALLLTSFTASAQDMWNYAISNLNSSATFSLPVNGAPDMSAYAGQGAGWTINLLTLGTETLLGSTTVFANSGGTLLILGWLTPLIDEGTDSFYRILSDDGLASIDSSFVNLPLATGPLPPGEPGVDNTAFNFSSSTWQVVPEPATALLFGIGGLGAFIVRRNKQKAQEEADA